jgi:exopolyphosphatase/guanosine-5'-triphosphate,3'-diphosphate pyrophosphatase
MEPQQYYLSADLAPRLAAIDIGTNSIRMIVAEGLKNGNYRILDDEKEATRIGRNLATTGRLDPEAVDASMQTLRRMKQIIAGYQVRELRAIATCAVREAADGEDFCRRVHDEVGLDIETVSAEEEARLAFYGVLRSFELDNKNVAVVDIGGGSTEIVLASNKLIEAIYTTPLGAVRITELYGGDQPLSQEEFARLLRNVDRLLRKHTDKPPFVPHGLIGSGGTFTALAAMARAAQGQTNVPLQGTIVTLAEVRHLLDRLRKMSPKSRRNVPGLSADRADIIVAGLAIVDATLRRFKVNQVQVHSGGVRDGLLLTMVDESLGRGPGHVRDRVEATLQFAIRCGVDLKHSQHVGRLTGLIFDQLAPAYGLAAEDRPLLETAAYLMDVGYLIDYDQHHKHSYHLISNSRLPGFQPHELELIANIARYHRGARPKKKHEAFRKLSRRDQERVARLAAILRLAGGLDRSHTQQVKDVHVELRPHEVHMSLVADELPEVDLWGARRRSKFFERAFHAHLEIDWQEAQGALESATADGRPSENGRQKKKRRRARSGTA